jgi:hypothetical protein
MASTHVGRPSACARPSLWLVVPTVWGNELEGTVDSAGNARLNSTIDLGAWEK